MRARCYGGALVACLVASTACAQDAGDDAWTFKVTPYVWAAGISGESGTLPGLPPADVDEPSSASVLEERAREH